ncbi:MAG: M55 family metallopeptidase [Chloroflexi bacterium]|nr:M55 family metallopeptidase [Anaerolineaceae bacterium]NMB89079.1 M55 family metallopeptidase [Chloroflexota bacterium]
MKLLIAVDMEGISGVVHWDQVTPGHVEYQRMRKVMTADVNAAVAGAAEAGVEDIIISDGHWNGYNILVEELDPRARLSSGTASPYSMVQGIETGVDAAFFVGYHARIGTQHAILDHTWSSARVSNLWLNGRVSGETGLNASMCGHFGAPVLMISGDQSVCAEASEWIPGIETVEVKQAVGRFAAECLAPSVAQERIRLGAIQAVHRFQAGQAPKPLELAKPITVTVEFIYSEMTDMAALLPGATRLDGKRVEVQVEDMAMAYRAFRSLVALAAR